MNREGCHEDWLKSFLYSFFFGLLYLQRKKRTGLNIRLQLDDHLLVGRM